MDLELEDPIGECMLLPWSWLEGRSIGYVPVIGWLILRKRITLMHAYAAMLSSSDMWGIWGAMVSCSTREFGRGGDSKISVGVDIKQDQELWVGKRCAGAFTRGHQLHLSLLLEW